MLDAMAAYKAGHFRDAAALLDATTPARAASTEATLLRARIYLKLRDPAGALAYLAAAERRLQGRASLEATLLQGNALARLGDERGAKAKFDTVAKRDDGRLGGELAYTRALNAWIARKLDAADRYLLQGTAETGTTLDLEGRVLRGAIAASRGELSQQAAILLDALRVVRERPPNETLPWAVIAAQISYLAREMPSFALRDAALAEIDRVPWTDDLAEYRFTMLHALAWRSALDGDYFGAFRRFKEARGKAPSDAWRVLASCDRAYLAAALGERRWSEQERSDADELAARVDWPSLTGEERVALLLLAELFAPTDAAQALAYIGRYRESGTRYDRMLASSDDRRVGALESYSFGVVHVVFGERAEALRRFESAWKTYDAIGYDWRAGRAAVQLASLTGKTEWHERAGEKLRAYPRSWIARATDEGAKVPVDDAASLTPAQYAVYALLLRGLSTAQIAAEQGRSEFTIRNHVKAIFKSLSVNSRSELLARARRLS